MKDKLKKILHTIIYILAIWGVISAIAFGVGSCVNMSNNDETSNSLVVESKNKKLLNAETGNYQYVLSPMSTVPSRFNRYNVADYSYYYVQFTNDARTIVDIATSINISVSLNDNLFLFNGSTSDYSYDTLNFELRYYSSDSLAILQKIYFTGSSPTFIYYSQGSNPTTEFTILFNNLNFSSVNIVDLPGETFNYESFLKLFFYFGDSENILFTFTTDMNPINYYSYNVMYDNVAHNTGSFTGNITLDMTFTSCGTLFKKMRFEYNYVLGTYYDNVVREYNDMTYLALMAISYQNFYTDEWVKVCYPRIYNYYARELNNTNVVVPYPMTDFSTYLWSNDGYKFINILNGSQNVFTRLSADPIANLTNIQVLTYQSNYNSIANNVYLTGDNGTNVFSLITTGFSSVMPLFAITLLPGLTIGTLMFLPLVVVIIFAIIRLLRK